MPAKCTCCGGDVLLFPCSGGSNVGQITNQVAVGLGRAGLGRMLCLAGIGGHVESMIESARRAPRVVAIDGCPVSCAQKTLEHAGIRVTDPVVVTELGVKKIPDLIPSPEDVYTVSSCLRDRLTSA